MPATTSVFLVLPHFPLYLNIWDPCLSLSLSLCSFSASVNVLSSEACFACHSLVFQHWNAQHKAQTCINFHSCQSSISCVHNETRTNTLTLRQVWKYYVVLSPLCAYMCRTTHFQLYEIWHIFSINVWCGNPTGNTSHQTLIRLDTQYCILQLHRNNTNSSISPFHFLSFFCGASAIVKWQNHSSSRATE